MERKALIVDLIKFLTDEPACQQTLGCLNSKAEIAIRIAQTVEISVLYDGQQVIAEEKQATAPDFIFDTSPEAISVLISEKGMNPAQLGIKLVKQIISRDVKVSMPSSIFQITRKGYYKVISVGGVEFFQEMKKHNLASLPKITAALKRLRR